MFTEGKWFNPGGAAFDTTLIGNSVWLDGSADFLSKTFSSGSAQTRLVFAAWVQRNSFTGTDQAIFSGLKNISGTNLVNRFVWHASDDMIEIHIEDVNAATIAYKTSRVFRDIGFYHLILSIDSNEADSVQLYVNGVRDTTLALTSGSALSAAPAAWGNAGLHTIGAYNNGASNYSLLNNYVAQATMLVGQSIQAGTVAVTDFLDTFTYGDSGSQFGPKDNIAALASSAGGNSFCLEFGDASDLGNDSSSNNNDFSATSMSAANQSTNTPSLVFPTLNALNGDATLVASLGFGNRLAVGVSDWDSVFATRSMGRTGKYYYEVRVHTETSGNGFPAGIHEESTTSKNWANYIGNSTATYGLGYALYTAGDSNSYYTNGSGANLSDYSGALAAGDIVMMAVDLDNSKIWWGKNGTFFNGNPSSNTNGVSIQADTDYVFGMSPSSSEDYFVNFGADSTFGAAISAGNNQDANSVGDFAYSVPSGFLALCSANLPAPDYQGCDWFDAAIYEGTGSEQTVGSGGSDSKFTALAWIKNRDAADDNIWMDRVIGTGGYLSTTQNDSGTAATAYGDGGTDILTSEAQAVKTFGQRSVTLGTMNEVNTSGESYVLWQWLIGDTATSAGSITAGSPSLTTTGLVADTNHFSIVEYTGNGIDNATFAHGLGTTPDLVIIKRRSGTALNTDWTMHVVGLGTENYIYPHYRIALSSGAGPNGMVPDANLVEIGTGVAVNTSGQTHMAYSFKNTPGLFKVGTYIGNSSTDGSYVSTGFKPRWIWILNTTLTSADAERPIIDTARYKFNGSTTAGGSNGGVVFSEQRAAEEAMNTSLGVNPAIDILADGFKLRANDSTINTGTTYLYLAMADIASGAGLCPIYGR